MPNADEPERLRCRYRFAVQPLLDEDAKAILIFRDWFIPNHPDYRVSSQVLTEEDGWVEVIPNTRLPLDIIPKISGYDSRSEARMMEILDKWEQHIRDAVKADCGVELQHV